MRVGPSAPRADRSGRAAAAGGLGERVRATALTGVGEVDDLLAPFRPEGVCHLAADPSPLSVPRHQTFENNALSTNAVMQAAGDVGASRLVRASSETATGWLTTDDLPPRSRFDETNRVDSPNAYALSELLGEVEGREVFLIAAADTCLDTPIQEAVARLHGPGAGFAADHGPFDSVFDCRKIAQRRGWRPRHSWRDG